MWLIKLSDECWSTYSKDDPCSRTLREKNARKFKSKKKAEKFLGKILVIRIFKDARVVEVTEN